VSYDLLFGTWDIIDNSAVRVNHKAKYGGWVDVLVSYFNWQLNLNDTKPTNHFLYINKTAWTFSTLPQREKSPINWFNSEAQSTKNENEVAYDKKQRWLRHLRHEASRNIFWW